MTELTVPEPAAAQPSPDWPDVADGGVSDPVVAQALARLEVLPRIAVAEHETVYSELHDELLAVLNSEPADSETADSGPANSGPTDGAA